MADNTWMWSPQHERYYRCVYDQNGTATFEWAPVNEATTNQPAAATAAYTSTTQPASTYAAYTHTPQSTTAYATYTTTAQPSTTQLNRADSVAGGDVPPPVPPEERMYLPNFIAGTPEEGWVDRLDPSYRMRTGGEARQFFKKGRVFATLYTEPTGETAQQNALNPAYTTVRFGASVFTQIRRFIVVSVRRHFVYAIAIATYGKTGVMKRGCNAREHAVVYNTNIDPETCYLPGERQRGLEKEPIQIWPADSSSYLTKESRVRFGKAYSIEWNVKVKDIGMVIDQDMSKLLTYYADENHEVG